MNPGPLNTLKICLLLLMLGLPGGALSGCTPPPPPPPDPVEPEVFVMPVFTQAKFEQLLTGMTYGEVADLLGSESTRQESTYDEGDTEYVRPTLTSWYYWENEDGSFIKAGFVDKKLVEKVAENLPQ
jgi:hypothetical protein